ncbi:hypothetical protein [Streptomyces sp. NPDC055060]
MTPNWAEYHEELCDDRDTLIERRPQGDAIVQVVRGSASIGWQDMQTPIRDMPESTESRYRLSTAYLSPDSYLIKLLCYTARR